RLVVEAYAVNLMSDARLTANGGGGGEGGTAKNNDDENGASASSGSVDTAAPAPGGSTPISISKGEGGQGAARNGAAGTGKNGATYNGFEGGGGGGGGAMGFIHLRGIQTCTVNANAVLSPVPTGGCTLP
ncbi:hypothetical protein ACLEQD_40335, partial [Corallococcus sp. 4LFB]